MSGIPIGGGSGVHLEGASELTGYPGVWIQPPAPKATTTIASTQSNAMDEAMAHAMAPGPIAEPPVAPVPVVAATGTVPIKPVWPTVDIPPEVLSESSLEHTSRLSMNAHYCELHLLRGIADWCNSVSRLMNT